MQSMDLFQGYTLSFWRIWHTTSFSADRNIFHFLFFWVSNIYVALTLLISRRITRTSSVLLIIVAVDISTLVKSQSFSKMNKYERSNITKENLELTSVSPTRSPSSPSAPWAPCWHSPGTGPGAAAGSRASAECLSTFWPPDCSS